MKNLFFAIALILSFNISAQEGTEKANIFVRVFDLQGKKINKGTIILISETLLQVSRNGEYVEIPVDSIGLIKTKRSAGNNVLIGAASGAIPMALLGAATADPDAWLFNYSAGEGAAAGAFIGGTAGAAIGAITILFKNSTSFIINGDELKLKEFKEMIGK